MPHSLKRISGANGFFSRIKLPFLFKSRTIDKIGFSFVNFTILCSVVWVYEYECVRCLFFLVRTRWTTLYADSLHLKLVSTPESPVRGSGRGDWDG